MTGTTTVATTTTTAAASAQPHVDAATDDPDGRLRAVLGAVDSRARLYDLWAALRALRGARGADARAAAARLGPPHADAVLALADPGRARALDRFYALVCTVSNRTHLLRTLIEANRAHAAALVDALVWGTTEPRSLDAGCAFRRTPVRTWLHRMPPVWHLLLLLVAGATGAEGIICGRLAALARSRLAAMDADYLAWREDADADAVGVTDDALRLLYEMHGATLRRLLRLLPHLSDAGVRAAAGAEEGRWTAIRDYLAERELRFLAAADRPCTGYLCDEAG